MHCNAWIACFTPRIAKRTTFYPGYRSALVVDWSLDHADSPNPFCKLNIYLVLRTSSKATKGKLLGKTCVQNIGLGLVSLLLPRNKSTLRTHNGTYIKGRRSEIVHSPTSRTLTALAYIALCSFFEVKHYPLF